MSHEHFEHASKIEAFALLNLKRSSFGLFSGQENRRGKKVMAHSIPVVPFAFWVVAHGRFDYVYMNILLNYNYYFPFISACSQGTYNDAKGLNCTGV